MKLHLVLIFSFCLMLTVYSQEKNSQKTTFVLVHGAWGGGWAFNKMDSLLTHSGSKVYRPTLTGLGEKYHLATNNTGLSTHIDDIVNLILFEKLENVILVGHSYGGMVVTGVYDRLPERISKLVYIDAVVPTNGESFATIFPEFIQDFPVTDGFINPPWVTGTMPFPKDVPQPLKTWTEPIYLKYDAIPGAKVTYILTADNMLLYKEDRFYSQYLRAMKNKYSLEIMESDHNPQWSAPLALLKLLKKIE